MPYILPRPLYLNRDKTKIVEEGDPEAASVLGGKGSTISDEDALLYGLDKIKGVKKEGEGEVLPEPEPETEPLPEPPAKATEPEANKAKQPAKNKGK